MAIKNIKAVETIAECLSDQINYWKMNEIDAKQGAIQGLFLANFLIKYKNIGWSDKR